MLQMHCLKLFRENQKDSQYIFKEKGVAKTEEEGEEKRERK